ncbi:PH domain-containing protein [Cellulomonas soli]|uniref:PH domain-containing protein n=1 Tax=Cellulomonas soli TaxID=931535 RepID=UPI003F85B40D
MTDATLHAPFRPRLARAVTLGLVVVLTGLTAVLVAVLPQVVPGITASDRAAFAGVGLLLVWFCWRQASVSARPDADGLTVRNLLVTRRLAWSQIVSVRFGQGRPWVQLDLDDGDTLAVMGVQRADGARAEQEARRLATLVALHTATPRDD